jgi:hypothetical protein
MRRELMKDRIPETRGLVTVRVLDRDMEQKVYHRAVQVWADLAAGAFSEFGGCIQTGEGGPDTNPAGFMRRFDSGYPAAERFWSATAGNATIIFQATFPAGALKDGGIREAYLLNGMARYFAYARLDPAVEVAEGDTLRIIWEITVGRDALEFFPGLREWFLGLPDR